MYILRTVNSTVTISSPTVSHDAWLWLLITWLYWLMQWVTLLVTWLHSQCSDGDQSESCQGRLPSSQRGTVSDPFLVLCVYIQMAISCFRSFFWAPSSPGSFLVRPSERQPGDYALAFRTRSEIRNWRIVQRDSKYFVHPRPNPYNSLLDIVQVCWMLPEYRTELSTTACNHDNISMAT